jgi:hypothetical protein
MPYTTINGQNSVADFTIDTVSYKCIFTTFDIDVTTEQILSSTFCSEPDDEYEPGNTTLVVIVAGLLKRDAPDTGTSAAGPLIPPPQGVAIVATFDAGCTISFDANFRRARATRTANQNATMSGEAVSTGPIVVAWDITNS